MIDVTNCLVVRPMLRMAFIYFISVMWMYLDSNRYNLLSALIMHEIDLTYISILHIYKSFFYVFFLIIFIFCHPANCGIWNTNRAYLKEVTGIRRLVYVSLLLYLLQSTSLLIYNSPRTPYGSMNPWKYFMKTLTHIESWCKIQPGCNWWAFVNGIVVLYTVVYRVFVEDLPNKWKYTHKTWHPLGLNYM